MPNSCPLNTGSCLDDRAPLFWVDVTTSSGFSASILSFNISKMDKIEDPVVDLISFLCLEL